MMCQTKAEGGRRCAARDRGRRSVGGLGGWRTQVGGRPPLSAYTAPVATSMPEMPADYQPKLSRTARMLGLDKRMTEAKRRLFWYREECGYEGPLNQDGLPCRVLR